MSARKSSKTKIAEVPGLAYFLADVPVTPACETVKPKVMTALEQMYGYFAA